MFVLAKAEAATTITLRPDATTSSNGDAFVTTGPDGSLDESNYGIAGALAVTATLAQGEFGSLLRFDVAAAKAGFDATYGAGLWSIDSIVLELTSAAPNNALFNNPNVSGNFQVFWFPDDSWQEGTGNPNVPATDGVRWVDLEDLATGSESEGTFSYEATDITDITQYMLASSSGLLSDAMAGGQVSLSLSAADSTISAFFRSRNFGTAVNRPALIITASAVPEPRRPVLLVMGAGCMLMRRCSRGARPTA